jgi:hypothetical protein
MDAKALYPSLDAAQSGDIIEDQINERDMEVEVDVRALVLHMAASHPKGRLTGGTWGMYAPGEGLIKKPTLHLFEICDRN